MPILSTVTTIVNDVYIATFSVQSGSISQSDQIAIAKFGEPLINAGGTYGTSPNEFTLPNNYIRVITDLPYIQQFDPSTTPFNTNTVIKAESYVTAFLAAYAAAFATLRGMPDTWTNQTLTSI